MTATEPQDGDTETIQDFLRPLMPGQERLYELAYLLSNIFKHEAAHSKDQFMPTPVTSLPTGKETGRYLAVYVGQAYLRVAFIELLGEKSVRKGSRVYHPELQTCVRRTQEKAWWIEERLRVDHAEDLFTWIGDCIAEVVSSDVASSSNGQKREIPAQLEIGISFCCPIKQTSVTEAVLMPTGKGYTLKSDLNLRQALLDGYERHTRRPDDGPSYSAAKRQKVSFPLPKLKISAMTNDTVATFTSLAYTTKLLLPNSRVVMGLIVGSGCNSTVPMKLKELHESKTRYIRNEDPNASEAVVSTEWTLNYASGPLNELGMITEWDKELERKCDRPGFQPFEYMVGGRYIGELVRIIVHDYFTRIKRISPATLPTALTQEYALTTDFLSLTVASSRSETTLLDQLQDKLPSKSGDWSWDLESVQVLKSVASMVQTRAAALVAASTVGILACTNEIQLIKPGCPLSESPVAQSDSPPGGPEELVVAFSGGVIQHYPQYKENCQRYIDRLVMQGGPQHGGKSVLLREASDGGIVGVGVLAGTVSGKIEGIVAMAMMPSGPGGSRTGSPFLIDHDDLSSLDHDIIADDGQDNLHNSHAAPSITIEADEPIESTTDRTPLTGNLSSTPTAGGQSRTPVSSSYLTSSIPGEDRHAPQNTIDESVWDTVSRDLFAVWEKMRQVLWPKYLLGGMMQRGGGGIGGSAERGEATGFGSQDIWSRRNLLERWPDADVVLQGGMSEGLRDWDLWGPLIFCLLLSTFLSMRKGEQSSLVFSGVFCIVWIGEAVVTAQIQLLGGNISFFQSVCLIGYTLFPLVIAALLSALGLPTIPRIPVYIVLVAWSLAAGVSILGGSGVVKNRVLLAVYPLFVFYIGIGCLCFIS
ncbi:hypothetical protein FQN57_002300 [Myotisia sp. PD_48]|nr:hypothetical protein FQN57_002300 [Myotisia sp. PD_48]